MKRRDFIGIAAAGAAGLALATATRDPELTTLARPRLLRILRDREAVRELGETYRRRTPAENNEAALRNAIDPRGRSTSPLAPEELRAWIDAQVQREFAEGRTVVIDGWVLSVTEARQCALYSLLA